MLIALLFILHWLFILLVSASPELLSQNLEIQPNEVYLANITGDFAKEISLEDISFYEGRKEVFFEHDLTYYNKTYYLYAYFNREGNFTLKIEHILYNSPELKEIAIEKQVEVKNNYLDENKTTNILSIKPGFSVTSNKAELTLSNKGNSEINISYNEEKISLMPNDFKKIIYYPNNSFEFFHVSAYKEFLIPIVYNNFSFDNNGAGDIKNILKADPSLIQANIISKQRHEERISLVNFADINLTDFLITSDLNIIEIPEISEIKAKEIKNISFIFSADDVGVLQGSIIVSYKHGELMEFIEIPVIAYIFPENSTADDLIVQPDRCSDLQGNLCTNQETCEGQATYASDGYCCIGDCVSVIPEEKTSYSWLIGLIIIILVCIGGFFFYKKYKKIKPEKPEDKLKETSKLYEKRIKGGLSRG